MSQDNNDNSFTLKTPERIVVNVKDLKFDKDNPNQMSNEKFESLDYSFEKWGYIDPIVVDSKTNLIANGEHRAKVLLQRGVGEVEVIHYDFKNDFERRLFRQSMNKIHGEHDLERDINEMELLLGYNPIELQSLLSFDERGLDLMRQQLAEESIVEPTKEQNEKEQVEFEAVTKHTCPLCGHKF